VDVDSTGDVSVDVLREWSRNVDIGVPLNVRQDQTFMRSAEPPSWVQILGESSEWLQAFRTAAAVYVAEIIREAAKETWKNRNEIRIAITDATTALFRFASKIIELRKKLAARTVIDVGVPIPEKFYGIRFALPPSDDPTVVALDIALFVHYLPEVLQAIHDERIAEQAVAGIVLALRSDGSLEMGWHDSGTNRPRSRVFTLHRPS
jgi:hypothetical protein